MRAPLVALGCGILAGVIGAGLQTAFFKATNKVAPKTPKDAFDPPESEQKAESATKTVARRSVEGLMQRGPASEQTLERGAGVVHYAFGGLWGGAYGLVRESFHRRPGLLTTVAFSALVWTASDNVILPLFKLGAWPAAYPLKTHVYALAAHVVYGAAVVGVYELSAGHLEGRAARLLMFAPWSRWVSALVSASKRGRSTARRARRRMEGKLSEIGLRA